jgi:putative transposase
MPWPHAPAHQLSEAGTYFITAATYLKAHYFHTSARLGFLQRELLTIAQNFSWEIEAWRYFRIITTLSLILRMIRGPQGVCQKC